MKSKLALLLYIIGLSAITYWAYPIIQERYFSNDSENQEAAPLDQKQDVCEDGIICEIDLDNNNVNENTDPSEEMGQSEESKNNEPINSFLEINRSDCNNECRYFEIEKEKEYCMQACGLSVPTKPTDNGCEALSGLERDYCWKNEAIEKTDFSICRNIEDFKIREVCQNRVTEDIIDSQRIEN